MIVDDFPVGAMENPGKYEIYTIHIKCNQPSGLITSDYYGTETSTQLHELAHMVWNYSHEILLHTMSISVLWKSCNSSLMGANLDKWRIRNFFRDVPNYVWECSVSGMS